MKLLSSQELNRMLRSLRRKTRLTNASLGSTTSDLAATAASLANTARDLSLETANVANVVVSGSFSPNVTSSFANVTQVVNAYYSRVDDHVTTAGGVTLSYDQKRTDAVWIELPVATADGAWKTKGVFTVTSVIAPANTEISHKAVIARDVTGNKAKVTVYASQADNVVLSYTISYLIS